MIKDPMPDWLRRQLEDSGVLTRDGFTRRAVPRRCAKCQWMTWQGLDSDIAAVRAICDYQPVSALGELAALLAGRPTYDLLGSPPAFRISGPREACEIRAARRRWPVLTQHRCGSVALPADLGTILSKPTNPGASTHGAPPF